MEKIMLEKHKKNRRERAMLERQIVKLYEALKNVPIVSGKVTSSAKEFPYIEEHVTVKMTEPREAAKIRKRITEKEYRKEILDTEIAEVELFIEQMPDGEEKRIFELACLHDMKQREIADIVGYSRGRISQIINGYRKD